MVEHTKWQFKSNGINFIIFDPEDDFRTVAECAREEDAKAICALRENVAWRTGALYDAQQIRDELRSQIYDLKRDARLREVPVKVNNNDLAALQSLARAAKQLCEWTRHHEYPEKMTGEFMDLTSLIDELDTEVRRIWRR